MVKTGGIAYNKKKKKKKKKKREKKSSILLLFTQSKDVLSDLLSTVLLDSLDGSGKICTSFVKLYNTRSTSRVIGGLTVI